jgi:hypothetical protein
LRRGQGGPVRSKRSRLLVGWMRLVRNDPSGEHAALLAPPLVDLIGPSPKPRIPRELGYRMVATSKRAAHPPCAPTVIGGHRCSEEDRAYVRYGQDKPETRQVLGGRAIPTRPRRQWRQTRSVGFRADDGATPDTGSRVRRRTTGPSSRSSSPWARGACTSAPTTSTARPATATMRSASA